MVVSLNKKLQDYWTFNLIDNFSQKHFLKNNETNKQEQNRSLNPKNNLCMERSSKQNSD